MGGKSPVGFQGPRSIRSWGAFAPDSREPILMAVAPGVMMPKL